MPEKTVLITGCSSGGIGASLAKVFHTKGFYVFATVRSVAKAGSLVDREGIEILELDVTSLESIQKCARAVEKRTGGSLDVLVNNAGASHVLPLLDTTIDEAKKLYDTNVWSVLAMTQAFAPMLVKAKGVLCNISSVAACVPFAMSGTYNSSKAAATMLSETLRLELEPLGVRVITVMVGIVDTPINAKHDALVLPDNSYYGVIRDRIASFRDGSAYPNKQDPDVTAKNIVHDVVSGSSSYIWRGKSASLAWFCFTFIPDRFLVNMMNGDKGLAEVARAYKSR